MFPYVRNLTTITSVHSADIEMSAYFKGPAMGYINSTPGNMETNQDINNNDVNRTSVDNRRASPGSRVCGEMEGQLAAIIKQLTIMEEKTMKQKWGLQSQGQERNGRRMKTKKYGGAIE